MTHPPAPQQWLNWVLRNLESKSTSDQHLQCSRWNTFWQQACVFKQQSEKLPFCQRGVIVTFCTRVKAETFFGMQEWFEPWSVGMARDIEHESDMFRVQSRCNASRTTTSHVAGLVAVASLSYTCSSKKILSGNAAVVLSSRSLQICIRLKIVNWCAVETLSFVVVRSIHPCLCMRDVFSISANWKHVISPLVNIALLKSWYLADHREGVGIFFSMRKAKKVRYVPTCIT